jgi:catalase
VNNYLRDGAMLFDGNSGRAKNHEPNSFGRPVQTNRPAWAPMEVHGPDGSHAAEPHAEDDYWQAGALYRLMNEAEKQPLAANIADSPGQASKD